MMLIDASAVVALLFDEPGSHEVAGAIEGDDAALSMVNLAEVLERVVRARRAPAPVLAELRAVFSFVSPTADDALGAALLYPATRKPALSLADRLVLAMAQRLDVPLLTAERAWASVPGVDVRLIRPAP